MTPYTALYDDVMPELPGADLPIVLHQIKRTCNDFYERSLYGREVGAPINIVALTTSYTAVPLDAANFQVGKIIEVRFNNGSSAGPKKLEPRSQAQLDIEVPNWDTLTGDPCYYTQTAIDTMTLALIPNASYVGGLLVTIARLPQYAGAGIDTPIYDKFNETLGAGVKQRMMRMPKKPWSNPQLALEYGRIYESDLSAAAAIAARSYGAGRLRTRAWA